MTRLRRIASRLVRRLRGDVKRQPVASSSQYRIIDEPVSDSAFDGWRDVDIARRQHEAYAPLLAALDADEPRIDFQVAAQAVSATGLDRASILEVGCGSGYYSRVFQQLLSTPFEYTGLDYSEAMIQLARQEYPGRTFVKGDATALPFGDNAFDIVMNGAALMHIMDYNRAIAESRRVARGWSIFHTVPVLNNRRTSMLTKSAYGVPVVEITFNRQEFEALLSDNGLIVRQVMNSIPHDYLSQLYEEPVTALTYICEVER